MNIHGREQAVVVGLRYIRQCRASVLGIKRVESLRLRRQDSARRFRRLKRKPENVTGGNPHTVWPVTRDYPYTHPFWL